MSHHLLILNPFDFLYFHTKGDNLMNFIQCQYISTLKTLNKHPSMSAKKYMLLSDHFHSILTEFSQFNQKNNGGKPL